MSDWISVKDRLPGYGKSYLVITPCSNIHIAYMLSYNNGWHSSRGVDVVLPVTHWMPLPAPPKEGKG